MRNRNNKGRRFIAALSLLSLGVFVSGVLASAQTRTNPGPSDRGQASRVTVTGTVDEVLRHACSSAVLAAQKENTPSRYCATTDVVLATKNGFVRIRLGPTKFIRENHFFFVDGDRLLIVGFLVPGRGPRTVVSEEVIKAKRDLTLRDPNGQPLWGRKAQSERIPAAAILGIRKPEAPDRPPLRSRPAAKALATGLRFQKTEQEKQHATP